MKIIKSIPKKPPLAGEFVAIDIEMFGQTLERLHRPHGELACVSIAYDGKVYLLTDIEDVKAAFEVIKPGRWVFHNAAYDLRQLMALLEIEERPIWDTLLVDRAMWGGYYSTFSLADLVRRYLCKKMDKDVRATFGETSGKMTAAQQEYAAKDALYTLQVAEHQRKIIDEDTLRVYEEIDAPMLWVVLNMKPVKVDVEGWTKLVEEFRQKGEELQDALGFNVFSPKQVKEAFYEKHKLSLKNAQKSTLQAIADDGGASGETAALTIDAKSYRKADSTYGQTWLDRNVEDNNYVHAEWRITGAECLPAGELVLTDSGYINVEDVKPGMKVLTHEGRPGEVVDAGRNHPEEILKVTLSNGLVLRTSADHPYLLAGGIWEEARHLLKGDPVVVHSNGPEEWEKIREWEDFSVSSWGRVRNDKTGNIRKLHKKNRWGHLKIMLHRNRAQIRGEDRKDFPVHRLVATAFIGQGGPETRHLNGIAWDNTVSNLAWGTRKENAQDAVRHGTMHHLDSEQAKLTWDDVDYIRSMDFERGQDQCLADELGVSREIVRDVRLGKRWPEGYLEGKGLEVEFQTAEVVSVVSDGHELTYYVSVEKDHSHVTGGVVTHNTGRMSCAKPNLQQIPARNVRLGMDRYRSLFVSADGMMIVSDVAQQEPRITAFLTGDESLNYALEKGEDVHLYVARKIFDDDSLTKKDKTKRDLGKAINLGLSYGLTSYGLASRTQLSEEEADELLNAYFERFPGVRDWMATQRNTAHLKEYVTTPAGRKIHMNVHNDQWVNNAVNAPIQGGAADHTKLTLVRLYERCKEAGVDFPVCMVIHDEIIIDAPTGTVKKFKQMVKECWIEAAEHLFPGVPFEVDVATGKAWDCK